MNIEEFKKQQRANQRQELLAIAYGNAPDNVRAEALAMLTRIDEDERRAADIEQLGEIVKEELHKVFADEQQPTSEQPVPPQPMSAADKEILARYCYSRYVESGNFAADEQRVYKELCKPRGRKAAARVINEIYEKHVHRTDKENPNKEQRLTFEEWLKMWAKAYGVKITNYKPAVL